MKKAKKGLHRTDEERIRIKECKKSKHYRIRIRRITKIKNKGKKDERKYTTRIGSTWCPRCRV